MAEKNQTNEIYQTLSKLREKYPDSDDIERLDAESKRIGTLLKAKELAENEAVKEMIDMCRQDILMARTKLATDRRLVGDEKAQRELWFIVEAREWFLKMMTKDFDSELESIQTELQMELDG